MNVSTFLISAAAILASTIVLTSIGVSKAAAQTVASTKSIATTDVPVVTNAWARATVPGQAVGAAYMTLVSPVNTKLLAAQTKLASTVEVHDMHHRDGVMQMRAHGPLALAANQRVELMPGGTHFMLLGLKRPLKAGETLQLELTFGQSEKANTKRTVLVDVPVRPIGQ